MSRFLWLAAVLVPLGVACTGQGDPPDEGPGGGGEEATIAITAPIDGEGVYGADVPLTWSVSGLTLDAEAIGGSDDVGHGHVHVYVDGARSRARSTACGSPRARRPSRWRSADSR